MNLMETMKPNSALKTTPEGGWEPVYILSDHWKSDLEFYEEDLRFLHHLVEKYILWITKSESLERMKEIEKNLFLLRKQCSELKNKIIRHHARLGHLVEDPSSVDAAAVTNIQGQLEDEFAHFVKQFRDDRQEAFKITEYIIDSESLPPMT